MKKRMLGAFALSLSLLAACGGNSSTPEPGPQPGPSTGFDSLKLLKPGQQATIRTKLKVNIVFVGYRQTGPGQVATARQVEYGRFQRDPAQNLRGDCADSQCLWPY